MRPNFKAAFFVLLIALTGCQEQVDLTPWWNKPFYSGHFPLLADHAPIFIFDHQAFIDAKSVIRDCYGNAIKNGSQLMFLLVKDNIALFDSDAGTVSSVHPLNKFANVAPNLHNILPTETINVDLTLAGDLAAEEPQCRQEATHTASSVNWDG